MQSIPWLTILVVWPLAGALLIGLVPPIRLHGRALAMIWSLIELVVTVLTVIAWTQGSGPVRLEILASWISQLGISYALGLTALGLLMIVLGAALVPLVLAAAWRDDKTPQRGGSHAAWLLALEASLMAVFTARDIVLFYVVFEAMLIPVYFLIGSFGGLQRRRASLKFLIYSLAGGLVMLAGVIAYGVYAGGDAQAFYLDGLTEPVLSQSAERLIFLSFFVAFAVKAPLWPVHTWLPDAAQAARPGTSALLVGVLDKVGTFGMITLCLPLFPNAVRWAAPVIIVLAVVSVVWGAVLALVQKDILRLIAYTSISHFGFIVLGIFVFDWQALSGASFYMLAHGLATAGLFLLSGSLIRRSNSQQIAQIGPGLQRQWPVLAGLFLVVGLAVAALPGMATFVAEFSVITGVFSAQPVAAVVAGAGVILAALYVLLLYQKIFTGPLPNSPDNRPLDLSVGERLIVAPLVAGLILFGCYPKPVLQIIDDPSYVEAHGCDVDSRLSSQSSVAFDCPSASRLVRIGWSRSKVDQMRQTAAEQSPTSNNDLGIDIQPEMTEGGAQ